jgi:hypothetical protein
MGLNQSQHQDRIYVNIVAGNFAKRVPEGTAGAAERTIEKKDGSKKTVWELIYRDLDAVIDSIEIDEAGEFGDQLRINMSDVGEHFTVTLGMNSREAKTFLCCLPNIKLSEIVTLAPYNFEGEGGKKVIGMNVYQGGKGKEFKVAPYYSKDTPNGLPQGVPDMDKDEFKILMQQQVIFLKKATKKFIAESMPEKSNKMQPNEKATQEHVHTEDDSSGLPF